MFTVLWPCAEAISDIAVHIDTLVGLNSLTGRCRAPTQTGQDPLTFVLGHFFDLAEVADYLAVKHAQSSAGSDTTPPCQMSTAATTRHSQIESQSPR